MHCVDVRPVNPTVSVVLLLIPCFPLELPRSQTLEQTRLSFVAPILDIYVFKLVFSTRTEFMQRPDVKTPVLARRPDGNAVDVSFSHMK